MAIAPKAHAIGPLDTATRRVNGEAGSLSLAAAVRAIQALHEGQSHQEVAGEIAATRAHHYEGWSLADAVVLGDGTRKPLRIANRREPDRPGWKIPRGFWYSSWSVEEVDALSARWTVTLREPFDPRRMRVIRQDGGLCHEIIASGYEYHRQDGTIVRFEQVECESDWFDVEEVRLELRYGATRLDLLAACEKAGVELESGREIRALLNRIKAREERR